jgi:hypothetical protein
MISQIITAPLFSGLFSPQAPASEAPSQSSPTVTFSGSSSDAVSFGSASAPARPKQVLFSGCCG